MVWGLFPDNPPLEVEGTSTASSGSQLHSVQVVVPANTHLRDIVTSANLSHSWTVPSSASSSSTGMPITAPILVDRVEVKEWDPVNERDPLVINAILLQKQRAEVLAQKGRVAQVLVPLMDKYIKDKDFLSIAQQRANPAELLEFLIDKRASQKEKRGNLELET